MREFGEMVRDKRERSELIPSRLIVRVAIAAIALPVFVILALVPYFAQTSQGFDASPQGENPYLAVAGLLYGAIFGWLWLPAVPLVEGLLDYAAQSSGSGDFVDNGTIRNQILILTCSVAAGVLCRKLIEQAMRRSDSHKE
jgi:hypothetical protein